MKRLKLFLLGGIYILIGIFNFSSAEGLKYDLTYDGCAKRDGVCNCPLKDYQLQNGLPVGVYYLISPSYATISNGYVNAGYGGNMYFNGTSINIVNATSELVPNLSIEFNLSDISKCNRSNSFTFSLVSTDYVPPKIEGGFSTFTPVITGIKDTTFQLIPLVVYIGIGVLIVTLGFYAVRWLVNWMGGKINSYFRSKRN